MEGDNTNNTKCLDRDSPSLEAMLAAYNTHQLIAVTNNVEGAIALEMLPLARIKRIMKQDSCDPHPRMISAEAIPNMAYAAQLFIGSLTSLAWQLSTGPNKRNTLQAKDLRAVVRASSRFDFLIDVLDMVDMSPECSGRELSVQGSPVMSLPMSHPTTDMHAQHAQMLAMRRMPSNMPPQRWPIKHKETLPVPYDHDDAAWPCMTASAPASYLSFQPELHAVGNWHQKNLMMSSSQDRMRSAQH